MNLLLLPLSTRHLPSKAHCSRRGVSTPSIAISVPLLRRTMLLKASSTVALLAPSVSSDASAPRAAALSGGSWAPLPSYFSLGRRCLTRRGSLVSSAAGSKATAAVFFESLEDINSEFSLVAASMDQSLARQRYADDCEEAINDQINVEYNASYVYHALFAYFDRDNVGLRGLAKFFKESSEEERDRAEKLMKYQNQRGGRVKLHTMTMPLTEFDDPEKGDALYAMELTLSLKKVVNEKLLDLYTVAERSNDVQMQDFIESEFLTVQVEAIKRISEYVAHLRRLGKGHGVWHFDQMLLQGHAL